MNQREHPTAVGIRDSIEFRVEESRDAFTDQREILRTMAAAVLLEGRADERLEQERPESTRCGNSADLDERTRVALVAPKHDRLVALVTEPSARGLLGSRLLDKQRDSRERAIRPQFGFFDPGPRAEKSALPRER